MRASDHSTGSACPAKTFSYAELTAPCLAAFYVVSEPARPPYKGTVSETAKRLASNVRLLRTVRGWSQETLALNAGLDRTFVGAVERAERNITLATAEKLAQAFGLTVADLLAVQTSEAPVRALRTDHDN